MLTLPQKYVKLDQMLSSVRNCNITVSLFYLFLFEYDYFQMKQ